MVKCAFVTRDKFVKYIHREKADPWFAIMRPLDIEASSDLPIDIATEVSIDRTEFRLDRVYVNEHEEKVAVYYEI